MQEGILGRLISDISFLRPVKIADRRIYQRRKGCAASGAEHGAKLQTSACHCNLARLNDLGDVDDTGAVSFAPE